MGRQVEGGRHFPVLFPGRETPGQVSRLQRGPSRQGRRGERRCMEPGLGEGRGLGVRLRAEEHTWRRGSAAVDGAVCPRRASLQAEGGWSSVRCGHSEAAPSFSVGLALFLCSLDFTGSLGNIWLPCASSKALRLVSKAPMDEAVSVFPGLVSALIAMGAPQGGHPTPPPPRPMHREE